MLIVLFPNYSATILFTGINYEGNERWRNAAGFATYWN